MKTAFLAAPLLALGTGAAQAHWLYGFDTDPQGWTARFGSALVWQASGGNPGGFLELTDTTNEDFELVAPPAVLGNWSAYLGGSFSFDAINLNGDGADWARFGTLTLSGPAGVVSADIVPGAAPAPGAGWTHFSITLDPGVFGPNLSAVLSNVTQVTLVGEFHAGVTEVGGIDNIGLAAAVPEPTTALLFGAGLLSLGGLARRRLR